MCGIIGVWGIPDASVRVCQALPSLQHRGQDSVGIVFADADGQLHRVGRMGLAASVLHPTMFAEVTSSAASGHVRYATTGERNEANIGPLLHRCVRGQIAVAHNGNLVNDRALRQAQSRRGTTYASTTDTEAIIHEYASSTALSDEDAIFHALSQVDGAYSVIVQTEKVMVAGCDPRGMRPLVFGLLGDGYAVASETCALNLLGATFIRPIAPGEMLVFTPSKGLTSVRPFRPLGKRFCVFEEIYLLRPDSEIEGRSMQTFRTKLGEMLAHDAPPPSNCRDYLVVPVPNSGKAVACGYARALGHQVIDALIKNPHIQRTFIEPGQDRRKMLADLKYSVVEDLVRERNVIIVDDSLVRGTTAERLTRKIRNAGAQSVHWRFGSPRIENPCFYGINMPTRKELLAAQLSNEEIAQAIGAETIGYLSQEGLRAALPSPHQRCMACFTGEYPTPLPDTEDNLLQLQG